ncbi:tagatose-bisphosphate aldolase [Glaesserella parasuis]|uniref:tagatose-bisphosphate aldolase n=1 Tax=Glaesserella parasuis TaxID=738 RepID=UPI001312DDA4|nr:tagatose-bisphosphate aldolase [Glaesserella parasuis]MDG4922343.1 tagatose-bisphosphate aldolase [Glaesserella parasuis]MDG6226294.1 tagatose-bisphosphate aldolase [Glaesserella parasuis]MDG6232225.1 tagatose-bisphosphate aldolase [Glaesserella parasuis]MDG6321857.1 tagatose-bisphosphate aldolase [Glaesserella parasuis]MDG6462557.1 tagatose-bisphosphate aldolase [Glaesserella parasuis]
MSKQDLMKKLCTKEGIIAALAIDQRGALRRMMGDDITAQQVSEFKTLISQELTPYASSILLDPEFGWAASEKRDANCGLIMAYEKTGYDKTAVGRFPDLIDDVSVYRLKEKGAEAVKLLIYFDIDEPHEINDRKAAFVERVASECNAEQIPLFLEILTYDGSNEDKVYNAKVKPHKVIEAMKFFADKRFGVDVLKVEVPVVMSYVEGFTDGEVLYGQAEAAEFFKEQSEATDLPFIFLSAGVSAKLFQQTLEFAHQAGSQFNGVLCGRATWAGGAEAYKTEGVEAARQWLKTQGKQNISELLEVLERTATPIK